jgi:transducin (beta)-like 1
MMANRVNETGFDHSAWTLRGEAQLDKSPNAHIPIPRGEILTLFRKALMYMEAEQIWAKKV